VQEIIEEILQTEAQCAQRVDGERTAAQARRAEAEAEATELVRKTREECQREIAERVAATAKSFDEASATETQRLKQDSERRIDSFKKELDQIVDRIVRIVAEE
jgi:uncharacterized protein YicC (UPF0701 family)